MPSSLAKHRRAAFARQNGRCHYCGFPMWLEDPAELSIPFGLTIRESARFQCTAEHLVARQDGGRDGAENIVAACRFCNTARHRRASPPDPANHRHRVFRRLNAGRWHPKSLRQRLAKFTAQSLVGATSQSSRAAPIG